MVNNQRFAYRVETSTNLLDWTSLTNLSSTTPGHGKFQPQVLPRRDAVSILSS